MGKSLRKFVASLAVLGFVAAWAGVLITWMSTDSIAAITLAVTIAAFATEALIWAGVFIFGWTMFANRKAFWSRISGRSKSPSQ
jgi:Na+/phosphate symporter